MLNFKLIGGYWFRECITNAFLGDIEEWVFDKCKQAYLRIIDI
jgi:hypothetical protein